MNNSYKMAVEAANDTNSQMGSALDTMLNRAKAFQDDGSAAYKEEVVESTPNVPNISINDLLKNNKLTEEALKELVKEAANDNFLSPTDPDSELKNAVAIRKKVLEEQERLSSAPLSAETYLRSKKVLHNRAAYLLVLECHIGEKLRALPKKQGYKKSDKKRVTGELKTKAEVIHEKFHLSPRQARDFQRLTWEGVTGSIVKAFQADEPVTRAAALAESTKRTGNDASDKATIELIKLALKTEYSAMTTPTYFNVPLNATSMFGCIDAGCAKLHELNVHLTACNEILPERAKAHEQLFPNCDVVVGDIKNKEVFRSLVKLHKAKKNRAVLSSPVCQVASGLNTQKNKEDDVRATLFHDTLKFVKATLPDLLVIENVPTWLNSCPRAAHKILRDRTAPKGVNRCLTIGEYLKQKLTNLGYYVNIAILNAADYGACEERLRCYIIACKKKLGKWYFPEPNPIRPVLWQAIGDLVGKTNNPDPKYKWNYTLPLLPHEVEFLEHTKTATSAWSNPPKYQPKNKNGSPARAQFEASYTRLDWNKPCKTITTGSGNIGSTYTVHPGLPIDDKRTSEPRVLTILELLRVIGLPENFLDPLNLPFVDGKLSHKDDAFVREVLGEHVCCDVYNAIFKMAPIVSSANDNIESADANLHVEGGDVDTK